MVIRGSTLITIRRLDRCGFVVENLSSGLAEVLSFRIGTINIGDRQRGRLEAKIVNNCEPNRQDIEKAFERLYSQVFG